MYNTDFEVKYYTIKEELIFKLNENQEYEYTSEDVCAICNKLYRDEIMSVFYADNMLDDKIDNGMKYVLQKMLENNDFRLMFDEIKTRLNMGEEHEKYLDTVVLLSLFSEDVFYLFHKCICQQLTLGTIEFDLLVQLNKYFIETNV